jgi:membrane fusion protein PltH
MKIRIALAIVLLLVIGAAICAVYWYHGRSAAPQEFLLYGNLDLRQVDLPFNGTERIAEVAVQEGDRVAKGQVLARLDTRRLDPQVAQAEAQVEGQRALLDKLRHGNRPEEIAEARSALESAQTDAGNARRTYDRLAALAGASNGRATSQQDVDNARAAAEVADARLASNRKALELSLAGARREDIAQADAQLHGAEAQLALLRQQLADAALVAPVDAVIRSRLMEPGEMASPQKSVFTLAVVDPKWVRAYVGEPDLGRIRPGEAAKIAVDAFAGRSFDGWIGFISPVAEFTPKDVQTEELRTSLVYEVRVFVKDPGDELRLGMPATVHLALQAPAPLQAAPPPQGAN